VRNLPNPEIQERPRCASDVWKIIAEVVGRDRALGSILLSMVHSRMANNQTRRNFLRTAPLAAAVSIPLTGKLLFASSPGSPEGQANPREPFQLFTAEKLADSMKAFQAQLGEHSLYQPKGLPLTIAMTAQEKKSVGEFEYHEGRDHVFLILEGATKFEVGGTPKNPRNTKPGEWLAPDSEGATSLEVKKGDMLVIPRGTPHRQSTEKSVTWMLISPSGPLNS
jgi:mannose-6-phosphate isomerase-like protein (cupin superfamily)